MPFRVGGAERKRLISRTAVEDWPPLLTSNNCSRVKAPHRRLVMRNVQARGMAVMGEDSVNTTSLYIAA